MASDLLGAAEDILARNQPQGGPGPAPVADTSPGQTGAGLRSGFETLGGQFSNLAGGVGEAAGFDDFAKARYEQARALQQQAAADAPRVSSVGDVHNLRDAFDYGTGLVGGMLPQAALAIGGAAMARTPIGKVLGATIATAPGEAGDIIGRQQADPVSLRSTGAGERLLQAGAGGALSAGAMALVPASVEAKLAGRATGAILPGIAREAAVGAAGGAGSETIKEGALQQSNPDAAFNPTAIGEAGAGGAIGGGVLGAAGAAGQAVHRAIAAPGNVLSGAKEAVAAGAKAVGEKISDGATAAQDAAQAATAKVGEKVDFANPGQVVRDMVERGVSGVQGFVDRVSRGEDVAEPEKVPPGADPEVVKTSILPQLDAERVQKVKDMATNLLDQAGLDEATRAQVSTAAGDLTNRANQAVVAGVQKAWTTTQNFMSGLDAMRRGMGETFDKTKADLTSGSATVAAPNANSAITPDHLARAEAAISPAMRERLAADPAELQRVIQQRAQGMANREAATASMIDPQVAKRAADALTDLNTTIAQIRAGTKKSEDYRGIHQAIAEKVIPVIRQYRPDLMANDRVINETGDTLRKLVQEMAVNPHFLEAEGRLADISDTFGPAAPKVLKAAYDAVYGSGSRATDEAFFPQYMDLAGRLQRQSAVADMLRSSMNPTLARGMSDTDIHQVAGAVMDWARHHTARAALGPEEVSARQRAEDHETLQGLKQMLGAKTDQVLTAIEKLSKQAETTLERARAQTDEEGNILGTKHEHGLTELSPDEVNAVRGSMVEYAPSKRDLYLAPAHEREVNAAAGRPPEHDATAQAIAKATKKNPDKTVSFITAKDLGEQHPRVSAAINNRATEIHEAKPTLSAEEAMRQAREEILSGRHGLVAAEGQDVPGTINRKNVRNVMVASVEGDKAKTSHREQPSVFKVDNVNYDARKIVKEIAKQFEDQPEFEGVTGAERTAALFKTGVAALQDHLGKTFEVPDHVEIDNKGTKFGDVKKLMPAAPHGMLNGDDESFVSAGSRGGKASDRQVIDSILHDGHYGVEPKSAGLNTEAAARRNGKAQLADEFDAQLTKLRNDHRLLSERINDREGLVESRGKDPEHDAVLQSMIGRRERMETDAARLKQQRETAFGREGREALRNGATEQDPFGSIHQLDRNAEGEPEPIHTGLDGRPTRSAAKDAPQRLAGQLTPEQTKELRARFEKLANAAQSAGAKAAAAKGLRLLDIADQLNMSAHKSLAGLLKGNAKASDVASVVSGLAEKYKAKLGEPAKAAVKAAKPAPAKLDVAGMLKSEDYSSLKTNKDTTAFLKAAHERWNELNEQYRAEGRRSDEAGDAFFDKHREELGRLGNLFESDSHADLSSFYPEFGTDKVPSDTEIRAMLKKSSGAAPEVAAQGPKDHTAPSASGTEDEAAAAQRSAQAAGTGRVTPEQQRTVRDYIDKVLGPKVKTTLANIPHAGEYLRDPRTHEDIIRISVHALNPLDTAYHESLHGLFARLMDQGNGEVATALQRVATSSPVLAQLREALKGEHAALEQLKTPEEAAAYMYQFWANGQLKLGPKVQTIFSRIAEMVRKTLGIWSADERAQAIMEHFKSGALKNAGADEVRAKLIDAGHNKAIEATRSFTKPLTDIAEGLFSAGATRLRATGIPALREMANLMKATGREAHEGDPGFIPSARGERARVLNKFGQFIESHTKADEIDALEAMQTGRQASTAGGRDIQAEVQGKLLPAMLEYMRKAGVNVDKIIPRDDYFPRQYDAYEISKNQQAFKDVLTRHGLNTKEAEAITANLMATNGAEFTVETDMPGAQFLKQRKLPDIPDAELAPFMRKDLRDIIGSYVTQATRRGEWARRFGDDGSGIQHMLERAKAQGASDAQVETARKFVRAVDGTLGDTLNPTARRIMGNVMIYQNLRLLPLSIFSSVVDPHGIWLRSGSFQDALHAYKLGAKAIVNTFRKHVPDGEEKLAELIGTVDSTFMGTTFTQGMTGDTGRKVNDVFFKYNFQEGFTRAMRTAATTAAVRFLERHADGTASVHSKRWLAELGLQPGDVPSKLTPEAILGSTKLKAAVNQWVDSAVLRPDAADRPIWQSDPHFMLMAHLKQFTHSFQETILKRVAHETLHGNYAPAMAIASYVPVMMAADIIRGLIQGQGQQPSWKQDWGPQDYVASGIERAGLLGVGQYAVDGPGMLAGPTLQQLADTVSYFNGPQSGRTVAIQALPGEAAFNQTKFNMADD